MKQRLKDLTRELAALPGVSGNEAPIVKMLAEKMTALADELTVDRHGNIMAVKHGTSDGPKLMIAAHSDIIGCIVRSVDEAGFLRLFAVGGVIDALLVAAKCSSTTFPVSSAPAPDTFNPTLKSASSPLWPIFTWTSASAPPPKSPTWASPSAAPSVT